MPLDTHFDRTTALRLLAPKDEGGRAQFGAELDETWASLRGVHGGYLTALAVRAAGAIVPDRAARTIATSFLTPAEVGPAELTLQVVRSSRSLSTVTSTLRQRDRDVAITRITLAAPATGAEWAVPVHDRPAPIDQCVAFVPPPEIRHFGQAELRIDPGTIPNADADDARIAGHVRPHDDRPIDAAWLAMIGDWFPPASFRRHAPPIGGVSIDYTVHVHRPSTAIALDLAGGWLEGVFEARTSLGGIALEHGTLATADGLTVAEIFHTRWAAASLRRLATPPHRASP